MKRLANKPSPTLQGILIGFTVPTLIIAPVSFWGPLHELVRPDMAYFLLPPFALLMVPGAALGYYAARFYAERPSTWHFGIGLFLGASILASLLFWIGSVDFAWPRRILISILGGPFLAGFWLWLGSFLGSSWGYASVEKEKIKAANASSNLFPAQGAKP